MIQRQTQQNVKSVKGTKCVVNIIMVTCSIICGSNCTIPTGLICQVLITVPFAFWPWLQKSFLLSHCFVHLTSDLDKCRLSASKQNHGGNWFYFTQLKKKFLTLWKLLCRKQSRGQCLEGVHHVKSQTHAQDHKHCEVDLKESMLAGESSARKLFTYCWVKVTHKLPAVQLCKFYFCCFSAFMSFFDGQL